MTATASMKPVWEPGMNVAQNARLSLSLWFWAACPAAVFAPLTQPFDPKIDKGLSILIPGAIYTIASMIVILVTLVVHGNIERTRSQNPVWAIVFATPIISLPLYTAIYLNFVVPMFATLRGG